MKKTTILAFVFAVLSIFQARCEANNISPKNIQPFVVASCGWHLHTSIRDDGYSILEDVIDYLINQGLDCAFLSSHTDRLGQDPEEGYKKYKEAAKSKNKDGSFVVFAGREITVEDGVNCHIGALSDSDTPYMFSKGLKSEDLGKVLDRLDKDRDLYVLNHVDLCKNWEDSIVLFHGIEMMNYPYDSKYKYYLGLYLKNKAKGWRGFVVGGADTHFYWFDSQKDFYSGDIVTHVFPKSLTNYETAVAIAEGKTVATKGLRIKSINIPPSTDNYIFSKGFSIKGRFEKTSTKKISVINVYRGGLLDFSVKIAPEKRGGNVFSFSVPIKNPGCYVLEIPYHMITSDFCFVNSATGEEEKKAPVPASPPLEKGDYLPGRAYPISSFEYSNRSIKSALIYGYNEKDATSNTLVFQLCEKSRELLTPEGFVGNCSRPLLIWALAKNPDQEIVVADNWHQSSFVCGEQAGRSCKDVFVVRLSEKDYVIANTSQSSYFLATTDTGVKEGMGFISCSPSGEFVLNSSGNIVSCQNYFGDQPSATDITANCPGCCVTYLSDKNPFFNLKTPMFFVFENLLMSIRGK